MTRRSHALLAAPALAVATALLVPTFPAAADVTEDADGAAEEFDTEVPEGIEVPLSRIEIVTDRPANYPRSLITVYATDPQDSERDELLETFEAEDGADGTVLTMPDQVLFDFGSASLRSSAEDRLERLLRLLEDTSGTITVRGHTDDIGTDDANQRLSEERAAAVADHLADHGIDAGRITTEGLADRDPVAPNRDEDGNDDPEGRQANRRVEVVVDLGDG